jgi:hypothetical protein
LVVVDRTTNTRDFFLFLFPSLFLLSFSFFCVCADDSVITGTPCMCSKDGQNSECAVGNSCWSENGGCKTEGAPAKCSTVSCTSPLTDKGGYCPGGVCTVDTCCRHPQCSSSGDTPQIATCQCGWGTQGRECASGDYCFNVVGVQKCRPNAQSTYTNQRCFAGFVGWGDVASTCPPNFPKRDLGPGSSKKFCSRFLFFVKVMSKSCQSNEMYKLLHFYSNLSWLFSCQLFFSFNRF